MNVCQIKCITTTKQSTTKPCAYFLGYTVYARMIWTSISWGNGLSPVRCKPLPKPMAPHWQLHLRNKLQWKSNRNKITFHSSNCVWKCRLRNGGHFIQGGWVKSCTYYLGHMHACLQQVMMASAQITGIVFFNTYSSCIFVYNTFYWV